MNQNTTDAGGPTGDEVKKAGKMMADMVDAVAASIEHGWGEVAPPAMLKEFQNGARKLHNLAQGLRVVSSQGNG